MIYHYHDEYCFLKKINTINTKCAWEIVKNECTVISHLNLICGKKKFKNGLD